VSKQVIYQGAEALLSHATYLGRPAVEKRRITKSYRIAEIDRFLISFRTKEESKLISEARAFGVSVPMIYDVNSVDGVITMQFLDGKRIKDILNEVPEGERKRLCVMIGVSIARLHNHDLIHGDITTSNMILFDDRIHFIDFGLGCKTPEVEAKGVDLHVLMEAFESTHSQHPKCFEYVWEGYTNEYLGDTKMVKQKIEDIVKRGRYR
jgi:TP53 regulating kinase-like protein